MKKFLLLAICALSVCLTGCSDNDTPEQLPDPELTLAPDAPIVFPAEGGSVEITVTTNMESWNAVSDQKWCNVAVSAGKFTVSAVENETPEAMPAATVTVTATSGERSVSRELQVSQEAGKEKYTDLSREGTSNCYLITAAGNYSFDATVRGNGATTEGLDAPTAIAGTSAAVVWQSAPGLISGVTLADGRISFKIAGPGNAVIAVKDGAILWSWHIWYPEAEVAGLNSKTGYEVMNMNLGAMHNTPGDVGSYGLLPVGPQRSVSRSTDADRNDRHRRCADLRRRQQRNQNHQLVAVEHSGQQSRLRHRQSDGLPLQLCTIQHLARLVAGRHEQRRPVGQSQRR